MPYRIKNWRTHYETAKTLNYNYLSYVVVPNKINNPDYIDLLDSDNGAAHLGVFVMLLQFASLQHKVVRDGWITRNGEPDGGSLSLDNLSRIFRVPKAIITEALPKLIEIGWIEEYSDDGALVIPQQSPNESSELNRIELNRIEDIKEIPKSCITLANGFYDHMMSHFPNRYKSRKKSDIPIMKHMGAETIHKFVRLDGHDIEFIRSVLWFGLNDEFWQTVLISLPRLRVRAKRGEPTKFENLIGAYERSQPKKLTGRFVGSNG